MSTEILAALKSEPSPVVLYWDTQDPRNEGPAYRTREDSGSLEFVRWAHISGRDVSDQETDGYTLDAYFSGPDGRYDGPDEYGIFPLLT